MITKEMIGDVIDKFGQPTKEPLKLLLCETDIHIYWADIQALSDIPTIVCPEDFIHVARAGLATVMNGKAQVIISETPPVPNKIPDLNDCMIPLVNSRQKFKVVEINKFNKTHKQKGRNRHVW